MNAHRGVDGARVDEFLVNARQLVCLHHDTHAALANVQCAKVAVQRVCSLEQQNQHVAVSRELPPITN